MATSNSYSFNPPIADLIIEAYSRIGIRGPALTIEHIIEARRSLNLVLADWAANRGGPDLWAISLLHVPLTPGEPDYLLPTGVIQILDVYCRQYQIGTTATSIGSALTALVDNTGAPVVGSDGQAIVAQPQSGVFDLVQGSQEVTMTWPSHGLSVGDGFQFVGYVTVGAMTMSGIQVVDNVVDSNTITFLALTPAARTLSNTGGTPLYYTQSASTTTTVVLPNHGFSVGDTFVVGTTITVGGLTFIAGTEHTIVTVPNFYSFTFTSSAATTTAVGFENSGHVGIYTQAGINPMDIVMPSMSRTDYASLPDKLMTSERPTQFWFERIVPPFIHVWPVSTPGTGFSYGLAIYCMRQMQDANPESGQQIDLPQRMLPVICAFLAAALAEKFAPDQWTAKMQYGEMIFDRASREDTEHAPLEISPILGGYFS